MTYYGHMMHAGFSYSALYAECELRPQHTVCNSMITSILSRTAVNICPFAQLLFCAHNACSVHFNAVVGQRNSSHNGWDVPLLLQTLLGAEAWHVAGAASQVLSAAVAAAGGGESQGVPPPHQQLAVKLSHAHAQGWQLWNLLQQ